MLATVPILMITAGIRAAPGAWLVPMRGDLGWSTARLSLAAAVGLIVYGFSGPLSGNLINRFGVRNVALLSLVLSAGSMAASSLVQA